MPLYGALEAGGTKMVCAVGDEQGNILERVSLPTRTPEETMPEMLAFYRGKDLSALGVGCFGPVDLDRGSPTYGSILATPKLPWRDYPIVRRFEEALGLPVGFDTDVNAAALGEATWGCTRGLSSSIYVTVGTGVGVGVVIDGRPYHGMMHPEAGHLFVARHPDDPMPQGVCPYHPNCLEGLASGPAIERRWGKKAQELSDRPEVWTLEAYYIAQALCGYMMILSPQRIILGGGVTHQEHLLPLVREEVRRQLGGYLVGKALDDLEDYIVPVSLNDNQGVMGAVRLAMDALAR
jgi:fructokinase